jgi:RNA polymerase sigma factor (TIGR02999 family)
MLPMPLSSDPVTQLLRQWSQGDESVVNELTRLVYQELHRLASSYIRRERPDHTLQATALIHEAYLRLVEQKQSEWHSRSHFFGFAAHLMRQILVDHARAHKAEKRGAGAERISIEEAEAIAPERAENLMALDEALTALASFDQRKAHIMEMRFFGSMSLEEIAQAVGISVRTVDREMRLARAWLYQSLRSDR